LDAINAGFSGKAEDVKCIELEERIKIFVQNALKKRNHKKKPVDFDAILVEN
jgi:hypothetical protein